MIVLAWLMRAICGVAPCIVFVALLGLGFTGNVAAQDSCSTDDGGRCCFAGSSNNVVGEGRFQSNGKGFSKGDLWKSYEVTIANSCNHDLVMQVVFDCHFSAPPSVGEWRVPPGGDTQRYSVLKPDCTFNLTEKQHGKKAPDPAVTDKDSGRSNTGVEPEISDRDPSEAMNNKILSAMGSPDGEDCTAVGSLRSSTIRNACSQYSGATYTTCVERVALYSNNWQSACEGRSNWPPPTVQDGYVAKDGKSESSEGLDAKGIKEFKARMVKKLIAAIGDPTVGSVCRVANYYRRTASNQVCGQYAGVDHKECISQLGEVSSLFSKACQGDVAWPPSIMSDGTLVSPKPGEVAADSEPEPLREPVPKPKPQQKSKPKPQQAKKKPQEDYCLAVERGMIGKSVNVTKNKCCPVPARSDCGLPRERLQFLCRNGINWACY